MYGVEFFVERGQMGGMLDIAAAVLIGNMFTALFIWGMIQFSRYDYQAPWPAYGAALAPILFAVICVVSWEIKTTGGLPPPFDALAPRPVDAQHQAQPAG